ncbi:hypothetical protein GmHk_04G011404 [Glycine max]|nr:hypothetical protein GmHk_04G011404 [Glycine max]
MLPVYEELWRYQVPSNVAFLGWSIMHDSLPTRSNLRRRNTRLDNMDFSCPLCHHQEETLEHLFFLCPIASSIWSRCWNWLVWGIWLLRNNVVFNNQEVDVESLWDSIVVRAWLWISCKTKLKHLSFYDWSTNLLECLN